MSVVSRHGRLGRTQSVPFNATAATSANFGSQTYRIRVVATAAALITLGDAIGAFVPPNWPEVFICTPGQSISVVEAVSGATGNLEITELE